jgi:hypothetical protein
MRAHNRDDVALATTYSLRATIDSGLQMTGNG